MLSFGQELSGYDLMKAIEGSVAFFWSPAKSQVYAELRRLVAAGYATERQVEQEARPDKRMYSITPQGEEALGAWLTAEDPEPETFRSTFLMRLFFGHRVSREQVAEGVRVYRAYSERMLEGYRGIEQQIREQAPEQMHDYPHLTLTYGIAHSEAMLRWCDETLKELGKRKGGRR
jgi:DNA-binding PadR family transcriptional regulator